MSEVIGKLAVEIDLNKAKFDEGISQIKRSLSTHTGQYKNLTKASRRQNMEWNTGTKALGSMRSAYQQLTNQVAYYNREMDELEAKGEKGSSQWTKYAGEMQKAGAKMAALEAEYNEFGKQLYTQNTGLYQWSQRLGKAGAAMQAVGQNVTALGDGLTRIGAVATAGGAMFVKTAMDYEQGMVAIKKTTNMSNGELKELSNSLKDMGRTMPIAIEDLQDVAAIAGQLGVRGVADITKFTDVMTKIGTATNLSASEAAEAIARFTNITGTGTANIERIGSALVAIGNNFATTEAEVMTLATRLVGTLSSLGATEPQIIGLAGAMSSLGISAEMGGTAISTFFTDMALAVSEGEDKLAKFAEVSKMTSEQFANLFADNPVEAFQALIKGLNDIDKSGGDLVGTMDELGIGNARLRDTITRLVQGYDTLESAMATSNQAFSEGSALQQEYSTMLESTAAQWEILKNNAKLFAISIGDALLPAINELFSETGGLKDTAQGLAKWFSDLDVGVRKNMVTFGALSVALGPVLSTFGNLITVTGGVFTGLSKIFDAGSKVLGAYRFYKGLNIAGDITKMSLGVKVFGSALAALSNPVVLATGFILGLGAAYNKVTEGARQAAQAQKDWGIKMTPNEIDSVRRYANSLGELQAILASGMGVDSSAYRNAVGGLADEIERLGNLKIDELNEQLRNLDPELNLHEVISQQVNAIEEQVEKARTAANMIDEIYNKAQETNRKLTDGETNSIRRMTHAMNAAYASVLGDTPEEMALVYQRLGDDLDKVSDSILHSQIKHIEDYKKAEVDGYEASIAQLDDYYARRLITDEKYNEDKAIHQKRHNDNMFNLQRAHARSLYEQEMRLTEQIMKDQGMTAEEVRSNIEYQRDAIQAVAREMGISYGEALRYIQSEARQTFEFIDGQIDNFSDKSAGMSSEAWKAAEKWNQAIDYMGKPLSELTDTEMEEFIQRTKEAGMTWDDFELIKKEAEIDDNTREFLDRVQIATFDWNGATLEQKQAFLETVGVEDVETILDKLGLWNGLSVEEQQAIVNAVENGEKTLSDVLVDLGYWNELSLEEKLAIVTAETGSLREGIDQLKEFNEVDPDVKDAIVNAIIENGGGLEEFIAIWQSTEFQEKLASVDVESENAMSKIGSLVTSWIEEVLGLNDKTLRADDQATPVIEAAEEKADAFAEQDSENTIKTDDQSSDTVSKAGDKVDEFGKKKPNVPLESRDVNVASLTGDLGRRVDELGAKRPNVPLAATDNATNVINGVSNSLFAIDGRRADTYVYTHYRTTGVARFKMGTRAHQGGPAILGDGGRKEPYLTPQGMFGVSPDTDTLYNLPHGTKVWPSISKFKTEANTNKLLRQYLDRLPRFATGTDKSFLDDFKTINLPSNIANLGGDTTNNSNVEGDTYVFNLDVHVVGDSISRSQADKIVEPIAHALERYGKKTGRRVVV